MALVVVLRDVSVRKSALENLANELVTLFQHEQNQNGAVNSAKAPRCDGM